MSDFESTDESLGKSPFAEKRLPQPSISHLMLWTLCSAIYLTGNRAIRAFRELPEGYETLQQTSSVFYGFIVGALLQNRSTFNPPVFLLYGVLSLDAVGGAPRSQLGKRIANAIRRPLIRGDYLLH